MKFVKPDGSKLEVDLCDSRLNLLAHAQLIELDIGSRCGGHGHCGGDRIQLAPGAAVSPPSTEEHEHLTPEELAQGWRLACQTFPEQILENTDLEVKVLQP